VRKLRSFQNVSNDEHERDGLHKLFTGVQRKILIKLSHEKAKRKMSELNGSEK